MSTTNRHPPSSRPSASSSRHQHKEATRQALLRAGLELVARKSFDSISLRHITRFAGVSPSAFYRHFEDTEELGLVLVEESFGSLRNMLRLVRSENAIPALMTVGSVAGRGRAAQTAGVEAVVNLSAEMVAQHVRDHTGHMRFIARERYGGVRKLRRAIRHELSLFADELSNDLGVFPVVSDWGPEDRAVLTGLLVEAMVHMAAELVDATDSDAERVITSTKRQVLLAALGVSMWTPVSTVDDDETDRDDDGRMI